MEMFSPPAIDAVETGDQPVSPVIKRQSVGSGDLAGCRSWLFRPASLWDFPGEALLDMPGVAPET